MLHLDARALKRTNEEALDAARAAHRRLGEHVRGAVRRHHVHV